LSRISRTCVPNIVNVNNPNSPDRTTMTIFKISISPWFLGSATNPSRVEKVQAQNREVQNTNCRKNL